MKNKKPSLSFAPYELRTFILPLTIAAVFFMAFIMADGLVWEPVINYPRVIYGAVGIFYILSFDRIVARSSFFRDHYSRINAVLSGIGLGVLLYILPDHLHELFHILTILGIAGVATTSRRSDAYITFLMILLISLPGSIPELTSIEPILEYLMPFIVSAVVIEAIVQIENTTQKHIRRLETINKVSRQIMSSLDTEQTISLLNATMQDALEADTYFIGIVKDNEIHLDLFYDEGEYYHGARVPLDGTLSGWVIINQKELFLPDLSNGIQLEGVRDYVIGRQKTSLSWIGVPLKAHNVSGVLALGSYKPHAFDLADMELLSNLAQHVTLALDNTVRHALVEEEARLDSLTRVYNNGYFLKKLAEQADEAITINTPISLIMLDIDFFKHYNDTYGHLVGDQVLNALCTAIQSHIKQTDTVGRWGGEEFIIALVGASGGQAVQVAKRIGETMSGMYMEDREKNSIPVPTVSQGIAVFPSEADEIYRLIDLADRRLYIAKERGRNQVEPDEDYWKMK